MEVIIKTWSLTEELISVKLVTLNGMNPLKQKLCGNYTAVMSRRSPSGVQIYEEKRKLSRVTL